ncbi:YceI family protein [Cumulibacter manganitolerans]|uniref:YceI family protein n=1 Tax=Cumulibacter manganitolerans TaxID=1884992 RepID=UPI0012976F0E|nr:YceI family protein [Cumulibacter manganitolerans]
MTTAQTLSITPGVYNIDTTHSHVGFSVRHMMVSKVRGVFKEFSGAITVAENIEDSTVQASIVASSVDTGNSQRDGHLQSADFFDAASHQTLEFRSTKVTADGGDWKVTGDLTVNGVTRPVVLDVTFGGAGSDGQGGQKAGFEAKTEINRKDFNVNFNAPMEGGGVVVGDKIAISLDIEADLAK